MPASRHAACRISSRPEVYIRKLFYGSFASYCDQQRKTWKTQQFPQPTYPCIVQESQFPTARMDSQTNVEFVVATRLACVLTSRKCQKSAVFYLNLRSGEEIVARFRAKCVFCKSSRFCNRCKVYIRYCVNRTYRASARSREGVPSCVWNPHCVCPCRSFSLLRHPPFGEILVPLRQQKCSKTLDIHRDHAHKHYANTMRSTYTVHILLCAANSLLCDAVLTALIAVVQLTALYSVFVAFFQYSRPLWNADSPYNQFDRGWKCWLAV